jgi:uncharacterized protein YciI
MSTEDVLERLGAHMARLKGLQLWTLDMNPTESWPPPPAPGELADPTMLERFVEHLDWLEAHERDHVLVLSGTIDQDRGIGPGMAIIRAASRADAERIAESEPFHRHGLRRNTVRMWTVNEGSLTITVKLFGNTISLS